MRILVLLPSLMDSLGGIQTYSQALVWSLNDLAVRHEWQVEVLALHDRRAADSLGLPRVRHAGFAGSKFRFGLASVLASRRADMILMAHVHFVPLVRIIRWLAPQASCRVAAHGIDVWKRLSPGILSGLRHVDEIWPVSDYTRRRMIAENPGLPAGLRFELLPNTLGPSYPSVRPTKGREELGLRAGKVVLCVSRMSSEEPYKNVELLLRAMPEVLRDVPDTKLVIVGPGDDRPRLEGIASQLDLCDRVTFAGRVSDEDLQSYLAASDLFVLPSTGEGFGIVYLEAMYHGKACIGANAGGVPEVIADGVTGVLVDTSSPHPLSTAIVRLLRDDATREAMGRAGKARLEAEFSMDRFRARLERLLSADNPAS